MPFCRVLGKAKFNSCVADFSRGIASNFCFRCRVAPIVEGALMMTTFSEAETFATGVSEAQAAAINFVKRVKTAKERI